MTASVKKLKYVITALWYECPYSLGDIVEIEGEPKPGFLRHAKPYEGERQQDDEKAKNIELTNTVNELKAENAKLKKELTALKAKK